MQPKQWTGPAPASCDICSRKLVGFFVDGKTSFGPWAIMCDACHRVSGVGLGVGKGQRYDAVTRLKVGG